MGVKEGPFCRVCVGPTVVGESELARESEVTRFSVFHLLEIYIRK
jgi:hypothetical protein